MKKLFGLAAVLWMAANVVAATVHVPGDYPSVHEAWNHVVSGDTIQIAAGNYVELGWENIVAGVTVEGAGWWNTILDIDGPNNVSILADQPDCVFRNFQVWAVWASNLVAIYATGVVFDQMVLRPTASGICFEPDTAPTLTNLVIDGGYTALLFSPDSGETMHNVLIMNTDEGLTDPGAHEYFAFYNVTTPIRGGLPIDPTDLPPLTANPLNADYTTAPNAPIIDAGDPDIIDSYDGTVSDIGCGYAQRVCKIGWTPEIDRVPKPGNPSEEVFCPGKQFTLYYQDLKSLYPPLNGSVTVQKFVVLDVYGGYYFWPSWVTDVNWVDRPIFDGYDQSGTILSFTWPQFDGEAHGLVIWAALWDATDPQPPIISALQFGYTSECS